MDEQIVGFDTAKLAKLKGFDWNCSMYTTTVLDKHLFFDHKDHKNWNETIFISVPSQSLLQKWLRDVHKLYVYSYGIYDSQGNKKFFYWKVDDEVSTLNFQTYSDNTNTFTYEEALEAGLQEALKLIE